MRKWTEYRRWTNEEFKYSQEINGIKGLSETGITVGHDGNFRTVTVRARREVQNCYSKSTKRSSELLL